MDVSWKIEVKLNNKKNYTIEDFNERSNAKYLIINNNKLKGIYKEQSH